MQITDVILKPIITEKSHRLISQTNSYTFAVAKKANKPLIKMAVENLFGVKVVKIRITQKKPKIRITGRTRAKIKVAGVKKAIVTLAANQKIPLFEFEAEKK